MGEVYMSNYIFLASNQQQKKPLNFNSITHINHTILIRVICLLFIKELYTINCDYYGHQTSSRSHL